MDGALRVVLNSHLFLGGVQRRMQGRSRCGWSEKDSRGGVGGWRQRGVALEGTGGHCCQWFWMQMIHQPPSCDAMQLHCQWGTVCALEIMHFSSRNCIIHPIYNGQPTVQCSFGPTVQPHSCCKSFSFYFHTLCICSCICISICLCLCIFYFIWICPFSFSPTSLLQQKFQIILPHSVFLNLGFASTVSLVHNIKMKYLCNGVQFPMQNTFLCRKFHYTPSFVLLGQFCALNPTTHTHTSD